MLGNVKGVRIKHKNREVNENTFWFLWIAVAYKREILQGRGGENSKERETPDALDRDRKAP